MAFRSGLEEKVADLLVELGVKYEYETTKVDYVIQHVYTTPFLVNMKNFHLLHFSYLTFMH